MFRTRKMILKKFLSFSTGEKIIVVTIQHYQLISNVENKTSEVAKDSVVILAIRL